MIAGIILCLAGLGGFCLLMFYGAVFVLPMYFGCVVGFWAINTGAGAIGGILVGLFTGGLVFGIAQMICHLSRSLLLRWLVVIAFVVPAAMAGYYTMSQFWELFMPSNAWQQVFAVVAAAATGFTALAHLGGLPETRALPRRHPAPTRPQPTGTQQAMLVPETVELLPPQRRALPPLHQQ
ncbi:MAG TPA: hypothetical protein VKZ79_24420 [Alphaproteobacteria bacterium]|nr:hypothetical protein [Alphaproteobacteria bacterium]